MALEAVQLVLVRDRQKLLRERRGGVGWCVGLNLALDLDGAVVHVPHQPVELILAHHVAHVHAHRHVGLALLRVCYHLVLVDEPVELVADVRERNLVRVKLPTPVAVREERDVAQLGVVEVLIREVRLRGGGQRHGVVGVPRREHLLHVARNLVQRTSRVLPVPGDGHRREHLQ